MGQITVLVRDLHVAHVVSDRGKQGRPASGYVDSSIFCAGSVSPPRTRRDPLNPGPHDWGQTRPALLSYAGAHLVVGREEPRTRGGPRMLSFPCLLWLITFCVAVADLSLSVYVCTTSPVVRKAASMASNSVVWLVCACPFTAKDKFKGLTLLQQTQPGFGPAGPCYRLSTLAPSIFLVSVLSPASLLLLPCIIAIPYFLTSSSLHLQPATMFVHYSQARFPFFSCRA